MQMPSSPTTYSYSPSPFIHNYPTPPPVYMDSRQPPPQTCQCLQCQRAFQGTQYEASTSWRKVDDGYVNGNSSWQGDHRLWDEGYGSPSQFQYALDASSSSTRQPSSPFQPSYYYPEGVNYAPPPPPRPAASLPRPSASLSTFAAYLVRYLWNSEARSAPGTSLPPESALASTPFTPAPEFLEWCTNVLATTQVSRSVVLLSLLFINRITKRQPYQRDRTNLGDERQIFVVCLMLANKILDDHTYTARTWSDVSGVPLQTLNSLELEFLDTVSFNVHVAQSEFEAWQRVCDAQYLSQPPRRPKVRLSKRTGTSSSRPSRSSRGLRPPPTSNERQPPTNYYLDPFTDMRFSEQPRAYSSAGLEAHLSMPGSPSSYRYYRHSDEWVRHPQPVYPPYPLLPNTDPGAATTPDLDLLSNGKRPLTYAFPPSSSETYLDEERPVKRFAAVSADSSPIARRPRPTQPPLRPSMAPARTGLSSTLAHLGLPTNMPTYINQSQVVHQLNTFRQAQSRPVSSQLRAHYGLETGSSNTSPTYDRTTTSLAPPPSAYQNRAGEPPRPEVLTYYTLAAGQPWGGILASERVPSSSWSGDGDGESQTEYPTRVQERRDSWSAGTRSSVPDLQFEASASRTAQTQSIPIASSSNSHGQPLTPDSPSSLSSHRASLDAGDGLFTYSISTPLNCAVCSTAQTTPPRSSESYRSSARIPGPRVVGVTDQQDGPPPDLSNYRFSFAVVPPPEPRNGAAPFYNTWYARASSAAVPQTLVSSAYANAGPPGVAASHFPAATSLSSSYSYTTAQAAPVVFSAPSNPYAGLNEYVYPQPMPTASRASYAVPTDPIRPRSNLNP